MYRLSTLLVTIACLHLPNALAQESVYESPEAAAQDPDFAIQGEYKGPKRGMQVIALGDGEFEAVIYQGGLPGDGWDRSPPRRLEADADIVASVAEANDMERVQRQSPTLHQKAPPGAVVLFDGQRETMEKHWKSGKITDDGLLQQGVTSKDTFQDFKLHIEFRTPYKPFARGQKRGNSGVYYQGRYETQVLDSFGLEGKMNETGGIYSIRDPDLNMCFPPLQWQTYDAEFTAAKFDKNGKKTANARLTVRLNGVLVQSDVELTHKTTAAPLKEGPEPGPIFLQNHSNPVVFRNIWVQPRDIEREARRPLLPSFERFFATDASSSTQKLAGEMLVNELACAQCHDLPSMRLSPKSAPSLTDVGSRLRPDFLVDYIANPHLQKPGTLMPSMLDELPEAERIEVATAISNFLLAEKRVAAELPGNARSANRGARIYHDVGCVACHAAQDGTRTNPATTVPLGQLNEKYTLASLSKFLKSPHEFRPSGRMPDFGLSEEQATDVATYLLRDSVVRGETQNVQAKYYEGNWTKLPDFDKLEPFARSKVYGFDLQASNRKNNFGARFETNFVVKEAGEYQFFIGSDDGSRLVVDGEEVIRVDGIHPVVYGNAKLQLEAGAHSIQVDFFEAGGGEELYVDVAGGGLGRAPLETFLTLKPAAQREPMVESQFVFDPSLVASGQKHFQTQGCVNCHQFDSDGQTVKSSGAFSDTFAVTDLTQGCLAPPNSDQSSNPVSALAANFDLSDSQRNAIQSWLRQPEQPLPAAPTAHLTEHVDLTMAAMNCYACHQRDGKGGPEDARDFVFKTTMQEMGDEGRLPPRLTGVGDKLHGQYLSDVLQNGANERPYMLVNMPGFGKDNLPGLTDAFVSLDQKTEAEIKPADLPLARRKNVGRKVVGSQGLSCVKCHVFGSESTPGIQAIDMTRMTTRIREDWFHRYLHSPETYRPGTRMPASFTDGKSVLTDVLDGSPSAQIDAMWQYLSDGDKAKTPIGVGKQTIELAPKLKPIIYRNFISGLSPRAIAVGYPGSGNVAWDANRMSLSLVWKNAFIDASKHWLGRGPGNQEPFGDEPLKLETTPPVASLNDIEDSWPAKMARDIGYQFLGYRLNDQGEPTFRYRLSRDPSSPLNDVIVEDYVHPVPDEQLGIRLVRTLRVSGPKSTKMIYMRLAQGDKISTRDDGGYTVGEKYRISSAPTLPLSTRIVDSEKMQELRLPVDLSTGEFSVTYEIAW
ncbi:MAG: family 16 glycoside hydrolase [Aureliella sp.]